ncbi:MAG: nitrous oxide-stimulated promoter family protein [Thermoplasmatales archaeon]|nr:MAG: nitrous oxide-stimulated promoter family protein [Thermoplasmatales archaeon]
MSIEHPRIKRERKTLEAMIRINCKINHNLKTKLCEECQILLNYAINRLKKCPFKEKKPSCARCTIHCYKEPERLSIKKIMRFSGPRMLFYHPILALYHIIEGLKSKSK